LGRQYHGPVIKDELVTGAAGGRYKKRAITPTTATTIAINELLPADW